MAGSARFCDSRAQRIDRIQLHDCMSDALRRHRDNLAIEKLKAAFVAVGPSEEIVYRHLLFGNASIMPLPVCGGNG
jgi:hypothetical protein